MLVIGDVTGRGARAASLTAVARYTLRTAATLTGDPVLALETLNRALFARGDSSLCSVVALAISEDPNEPVRLAVAGHPPPLLIEGEERRGDQRRRPRPRRLCRCRAGPSPTAPSSPGQQLVVVTDGVTEAQGPAERFGEERLRSELGGATDPSQVVQRVEGALQAFTGGALDDDIAMLADRARRRRRLEPPEPRVSNLEVANG